MNRIDQKRDGAIRVRHGDPIMTLGEKNVFYHTVADPVGIHARPAGAIVGLVKNYRSEVLFSAGEKTAKADSIISLMTLGAGQGTRLRVEAHGPDAEEAVSALRAYLREHL